ncbi:MAG: hypothetical protein A3A96_01060 [Candidatus Zambryskibacteria bacterium RIFCSPLOWO2_01_FULL_39_39]|uniref:Short-chain dehydrogenase n=1 Tax=Candidatus Zambryskibacteria bacterium RIFCSPLOWO2_01_FULL_39_39 TaxID=1802758 RepID=A0A1G2TYR1_9BACT|nr:MAG: Short-chain dehydrogenase/reductase SDR [Parcubacteria group bacterium GW2011_GWA1_38_7]OHA87540.1 MAG: hypothetical protein A2644_04320 [Candidatus Zambryskibacteria bacterium RIFCSPHIGHO2_01_FULL_39_63]OHA95068.1 MAG: hypothetical protein A3B88_03230 [Candidatus Zambryskibacteria bacterium RIFCSPHIGHO2_02_FULL_39_19]OHA98188.1 MAG: hypothetical protein A3F20_04040 [Candidatus Zambryskibacteria bacterium RIFCSPHIGHO2_12_FULL_39_21]OHB02446.1 MAG: hypothetical protein A3A96_01060 [Candi
MQNQNQSLVVCVTGASSGIGRELSKQLIQSGYIVVGIARRKNLLEELASELNNKKFHFYEADVSNLEEIKKVKDALLLKKLIPGAIVCGASISQNDTEPNFKNDVVRKIMEINFFGTANMVDVFLPEFLKTGHGHFICLSSIASWRPSIQGATYPASKATVGMFFRGLNLRYKPLGVDFSTIYLGPVETEMWEGKPSFVVATPNVIAKKIIQLILNPKPISYIPFLSTTLSRLSTLIPDWLYAKLSSYLFK